MDPPPATEPVQVQEPQHAVVDLNALCQNIEKSMSEIDNQRTTLALEQINQDLKICLPLLSFEEQQKLLLLSTQMYVNFLKVERTAAQQNTFEQYAFDTAQHPTIQQSHFETLTLRDQYLLKHQGRAYIEIYDAGIGHVQYRRNPEYLARIFAPYMPQAEQVFISNLAKQNAQPTMINGHMLIDSQEIVNRALFWENYIQQYPYSSYINDAKYLYQTYRYFLFKGDINKPVSDINHEDLISVDRLSAIEKLSQFDKSALAKDAQKFLTFLNKNDTQRQAILDLSAHEENLPEKQLDHYLKLPTMPPSSKRNCFVDSICH